MAYAYYNKHFVGSKNPFLLVFVLIWHFNKLVLYRPLSPDGCLDDGKSKDNLHTYNVRLEKDSNHLISVQRDI